MKTYVIFLKDKNINFLSWTTNPIKHLEIILKYFQQNKIKSKRNGEVKQNLMSTETPHLISDNVVTLYIPIKNQYSLKYYL